MKMLRPDVQLIPAESSQECDFLTALSFSLQLKQAEEMKLKSVETDKQLEKELAQCRSDAEKLETMTMEEAVSVTLRFLGIVAMMTRHYLSKLWSIPRYESDFA